MRNGEFIPPLDAAIIDNRYDRLGLNFWRWITQEKRVHGHVSGYDDEQGNGGATDLGLELRNVLGKPNSVDLTLFATAGQFEDLFGGRLSYSRFTKRGRWDVLYELGQHHLNDFPDDRDDIIQHRVRGSWSIHNDKSRWDFTAYAQGVLYDDELSWSAGITFQKRF